MTFTLQDLQAPCPCESGKRAGYCCAKNEPCPCGSGEAVSHCCMKEEE